MKNSIIKAGIILLALSTAAACTGNYLNINTHPYEVDKDQMMQDDYIIGATLSAICGTVVSPDVITARFTDCLLGGPMGVYYSSTGSWGKTIDNFNATDDWTRVFMSSDRVIPTLFTNLKELREITDDPVIHSMATVVKVAAMQRVTDTYGPIPYSKIGVDLELLVPYDSQEQVYDKMFEELDAAILVLEDNASLTYSANADPVYRGSIRNWCKLANSLKLRLAMRIVYTEGGKEKAAQKFKEVMEHPIGAFTSNADNAALQAVAFGDKGNPLYTAVKYNQIAGSNTGGDTHAAADITSYMTAYNDPRCEKYFIESEFEGEEFKYTGALISVVKPPLGTVGRKYAGVNIGYNDPLQWMNAAEVAFLKAEAVVLGVISGNAEEYYNEGIRLSFDQYGVSSAYAAYISNDKKTPVTYVNPEGESRPAALTELAVKWDDAATAAEQQERILIQKWIANFNLGNEAWADHRRTGYPKFFPASDEGNMSGGIVDNEFGARRMPYPQDERTSNAANYSYAVANLLGGRDNMATRLWWDCNPAVNK